MLNVETPKKEKKKVFTMKELIEKIQRNPAAFQPDTAQKRKYKRTRKRVNSPKQVYLYSSQRQELGQLNETKTDEFNPLYQAHQLGLVKPETQHTDALVDSNAVPEILGQVKVGDGSGSDSGSLAYVVYKPVGWSILGSASKRKMPLENDPNGKNAKDKCTNASEYDENNVLALSTFQEREDCEKATDQSAIPMEISNGKKKGSRIKRVKVKEDDGSVDILEYDESDMFAVMTPEEIHEYVKEGGFTDTTDSTTTSTLPETKTRRAEGSNEKASFAVTSRSSVMAWLKELKAKEGTPIRGGKYWTAIAGATNVDDTGLVVICPKNKVDNVFVDYAKYVAVIGNGKYLAPKSKTKNVEIPKEFMKMDIISKLRKGRNDDTVLTVGVTVVERMSTCNGLVQPCQRQFLDGIRGDPAANPLDRRASRRLIHCQALSVSSLVHDDAVQVEIDKLPDDIAILAERRNNHEFVEGSFLGRASLRANPLTTAYREINGAADGFPGWTVDRYGKWLFVQHDEMCYKGPLPSIHDGNTYGVYYLPANPNRSAMGSKDDVRPKLLEGQHAPDVVPILENGITYHISLDKDLSTGIFLDQRQQRAWLARNCDESTRMLNCFAHCGAFSVAAATAGASTVSLDLNKKWLDRIEPQLRANGIDFDDKHDCIYGDCKFLEDQWILSQMYAVFRYF
jgi:S-adenosylmethionine-dependent methyltransferase